MDWSRAKTYLILTFLILDVLLGYQYYTAQQQAQEYVQSYSTQLQELKDVLKAHKLVLQTDVPKETPIMRFLQVSRPKQPSTEIVNSLFQNARMIENDKNKGTMKFHADEGDFTVSPDSSFAMQYDPYLPINGSESNAKLAVQVLQKIAPNLWQSSKYAEDITTMESKDHTTIHYVESYDKYPVFSTDLTVELQNSQIIGYNQKALSIGSEEENGQHVLSAISAIRSITDTLDPKMLAKQTGNTAIRDIKLGYYSPNYDDADVWYLVPMWRVMIGQSLYYVNAFTGQVENGAS
ncbi:MAG: two-component system regulatory protein YycI [Tumebacillaceae bacterium]